MDRWVNVLVPIALSFLLMFGVAAIFAGVTALMAFITVQLWGLLLVPLGAPEVSFLAFWALWFVLAFFFARPEIEVKRS